MEIKKADENAVKKSDFDPVRAIIIIIVFMIVVWIIWFAVSKLRSGTGKEVAKSGFNLASSSIPKKTEKATPLQDSFYKNYVKIYNTTSALETYPEKEVLEVRVLQANLSAVDITNWRFVNSAGESAYIGKSAELPVGGKVNQLAPTQIKGNDILFVSSGRSPIGISFRLNSCIGYFEQFQDFIPPLPNYCPGISNDKNFQKLEYDCQSFAYTIPSCTANIKAFPVGTSAGCKAYIIDKLSYNGCVATNKTDRDFYKTEWRIFLGRSDELWAEPKDTITLLDDQGKLVDSVSYGK
jgi:hypothetical protein